LCTVNLELRPAFVHANLRTLGPFKYVLATPVFHRWHHTPFEDGGDTNFAGTFPIWDILFGTFRMPKNRLPKTMARTNRQCRPRSSGNGPTRSGNKLATGFLGFVCSSFIN
jgi:sterol desaturase/sphingolipid hydroxylase (fatty acid hydroxylase superfamily)